MGKIELAKQAIRKIISNSSVEEDPIHAENTLTWLLKLDPAAGEALQIAALAHDIDRACPETKTRRQDYADYDAFKAEHAKNGARIVRKILEDHAVSPEITDKACALIILHEVGGNPEADLLKNADSISYFDHNLPFYFDREGYVETKRRCIWGYQRLSNKMQTLLATFRYENQELTKIIQEVIVESGQQNGGTCI
ncbi:MAG: DUF4202 family protein [Deltaproteobacteria bacterium]|nr:DUF4202 family protein [Deltaproteobacteria bacterium]